MAYLIGVDVSWPNGNYRPGNEAFVGIGAVSLDGGDPFVQDTYHQQVDNARAVGKEIIHYAFNGRTNKLSPTVFADYLVDNLYDYRPGDGLALDVESSEGGKYPAWSPQQAREFRDRLQARVATRMGVYGNRSDMGKAGWGALHDTGTWLWIAWPGDESELDSIGEWGSDWQIWQHGISNNVDQDYAKTTIAALCTGTEGDRIVQTYHSEDRTTRQLAQGQQTFLHNDSAGLDVNIVGGIGPYVITSHIYADGLTPGDALDVALIWENTSNTEPWKHASEHYTQRMVADQQGVIRDSTTFQRAVVSGDMVFVRVTAPTTNRGTAQVSLIDADAALFA